MSRWYRIEGEVQGVGFRRWTRRVAGQLGLEGAVRNCPDGTVEVRAHGAVSALDVLERALRTGPPRARVERVDVAPEEEDVGPEEHGRGRDADGGWQAFERA